MKYLAKKRFFIGLLLLLAVFLGQRLLHSPLWQWYSPQGIGPNNTFQPYEVWAFDDDLVILNSQDKSTYALSQKTGETIWQFTANNYSPFPPVISENQVYLANFDGTVYSLEKNTGYELWRFQLPDQTNPDTPVVVSADGKTLFIGSRGGTLLALNARSGEEKWRKSFATADPTAATPQGLIHFGALFVEDDILYISHAPEQAGIALDPENGQELWRVPSIPVSFTPPPVTHDFVVWKKSNQLVVVEKHTGQEYAIQKKAETSSAWSFFPAPAEENAIFIQDGNTVSKRDLRTRQEIWSISGVAAYWKNERSNDGNILVQKLEPISNQNTLFLLDASTGKPVWETALPTNVLTSDAELDDVLLLGEKTGHLIALQPNTGEILWQSKLSGEIKTIAPEKGSFAVIAADSSGKYNFYLFDTNGSLLWKYTPDSLLSSRNIATRNSSFFFLDEKMQLLEKIPIGKTDPEKLAVRRSNFTASQNTTARDPYLEFALHESTRWKIRKQLHYWNAVFQNIGSIRQFDFQKNITDGLIEFTIAYDERLLKNHFTDLTFEATFTHKETGERTQIKGYYLDHNTWKIRWRPSDDGEYTWSVVAHSPFGTKKWSGVDFISADTFSRIKIQDDTFVLDNQVFFPVGIQELFIDHNFDGRITDQARASFLETPTANAEEYAYTSLENELSLYAKEAGINIFRYGVDNWSPSLFQSLDLENIRWDVRGGHFGDALTQELRANNIHTIMTLFGFYPPFDSKEEMRDPANRVALARYLDYVIARYSSEIDMWEIGNEARSDQEWYDFVLQYLKKNDPYHRPVSTNWEDFSLKETDFESIHWYNPNTTDSALLLDSANFLENQYGGGEKPVLLTEFGFKNASWFPGSSESVRVLSWLTTFQKMGIIFWNQGQNGVYQNPDNANAYLGPVERQYLSHLTGFLPKMTAPVKKEFFALVESGMRVFVLKNQEYYLAYLLKTRSNQNAPESITLELERSGVIEWIDPKTGAVLRQEEVSSGTTSLIVPRFEVDLALKITH